jgi:hypothetical protein
MWADLVCMAFGVARVAGIPYDRRTGDILLYNSTRETLEHRHIYI